MQDSNSVSKQADSGSAGDFLAECQEFALACLPIAVSQCLTDILADFSNQAGLLDDAPEQVRYALCNRNDELMTSFNEHLAEQMSGKSRLRAAATMPRSGVLQVGLMLEDEHHDFTAPEAIAAAIGTACSSELYSLNRRFEYKLGSASHRELPFGPRQIGQAMMAALKTIGMPLSLRQHLLPGVIEYLPGNVRGVYQALNQAMIERGVLPRMQGGAIDKTDSSAIAGACRDWIARRKATASDSHVDAPMRPLLWHLDALQTDSDRNGYGLEIGALLNAGANLAREVEQRMQSVLGASDKVLLNWLAVLFDGVFIRTDLDSAYREVFGYLQWPMLKAVLHDQEGLIDDLAHPAQRLFGAWVQAADRHQAKDEHSAARLARMHSLVDGLSGSPRPDFLTAWQRWCASDADAGPPSLNTEYLACHAEPIRMAVSKRRIPRAMESFLVEHRLSVLSGIGSRHGEGSAEWQAAVEVMDDLLATLDLANWQRDRNGLSVSLAGTLERLRDSMEIAGMTGEASNRFFSMLVKYHAILMKAAQGRSISPVK